MLFEKETYVRYSEVDKDGLIKIDALVNHLQDIVMLHADEVGAGIAQVIDMGTVWFISTWQIEIITPPRIYDKIILKTNPYEFKGIFGNRNDWIENEKGEILVRANSIWVYLDVKTKVPRCLLMRRHKLKKPLKLPLNSAVRVMFSGAVERVTILCSILIWQKSRTIWHIL